MLNADVFWLMSAIISVQGDDSVDEGFLLG